MKKKWRGVSPLQRSPPRSRGSQPGATSAGKRSLHNICMWKLAGIASIQMRWRGAGDQGAPFEGLLHKLAQKLAHSKPQCKGSSSKSTRDMQLGIKLTSVRAKAKGIAVRAALSWQGGDCTCHCSFVKLNSYSPCRGRWAWNLSFPLTGLTLCTLSWRLSETHNSQQLPAAPPQE